MKGRVFLCLEMAAERPCSRAIRATVNPLGAWPVEDRIISSATPDAMPYLWKFGFIRRELETRLCAGGDLNAQVPAAVASTQTGSPIHARTASSFLRLPLYALRAIADNASAPSIT